MRTSLTWSGAVVGAEEFAALMAPLGPFEPTPRLAAAVSGGSDSMALAWLAAGWARARGGGLVALVVDHRLRAESSVEAARTVERLAEFGVGARILVLGDLAHGPALAERARGARYAALEAACCSEGLLHLLLGHHAADQAETVAMRMLARSGPDGLAGMAALVEAASLRRLRPLLRIPRRRLRATLRAAGVEWAEDPSNRDPASLRARLRGLRADADGTGPATCAAVLAADARGASRAAAEVARAAELARRVRFYPEGYAILSPGPIDAATLAALLRTLAGAKHAPPLRQVEPLAAAPGPATLAGVRIMPARRAGTGWLLLRESAAMAAEVAARPEAMWDGRFTLSCDLESCDSGLPPGTTLGPLGEDATGLRRRGLASTALPAAVLPTLPALRRDGILLAVPHLRYTESSAAVRVGVVFEPANPAACAPFAVC